MHELQLVAARIARKTVAICRYSHSKLTQLQHILLHLEYCSPHTFVKPGVRFTFSPSKFNIKGHLRNKPTQNLMSNSKYLLHIFKRGLLTVEKILFKVYDWWHLKLDTAYITPTTIIQRIIWTFNMDNMD